MAAIATFYDHVTDMAKQKDISVNEAMEKAAALGYTALEVAAHNFAGREREVARQLESAGLGVSSVPTFYEFGKDRDVKQKALPALEGAKLLGADKMLVIPGFYAPEDSAAQREEQRQRMAECINELAELAAGYGVSLIMEDFDNALSPCSTAEGMLWFMERCPGLSTCFDTGNFRFAAQGLSDAYEKLRGRIAHVHLKDRSYRPLREGEAFINAADGQKLWPCPVGGGDLEIAEIIGRLKADGYDGLYSVEHYMAEDQLAYLEASAEWVKCQM